MRTRTALVVGVSLAFGMAMFAADHAVKPPKQAAAAEAFVKSLSESERAASLRPLDDGERTKWIFTRDARPGLYIRDMDADTRQATLALADSFLSAAGREQWRLIRVVEAINAVNEKARGTTPPTYGDDLYAVCFFGSPSDSAWAFQIEGHHFVLNAACADGVVTVTPAFTGSFPAAVESGADKAKRPLGAAVEVAFELAKSFDDAQRKTARIMDGTPADVMWAVGSDAKEPDMRGVTRAEMTDAQKKLVDKLLAVHAGLLDEDVASAQLREWREKFGGKLAFAFVGETALDKSHYYRLTSPCFTIEYDSTNADASHVHCVWSDPHANFGGDALRAHLKGAHAAPADKK